MNKDVIYIEPEDDITDIITKIEKSKEKIVALVPPKKAGVFRSVVNIKLINKSGKSADKTVVLVTTDPSIVKLAAATMLPVTKDLQTAPVIPTVEDEEVDNTSKEELVEDNDDDEEESDEEESSDDKSNKDSRGKGSSDDDKKEKAKEDKDDNEEEEEEEEEEEKPKKGKKEKKKGHNNFVEWIKNHKKTAIIGGIGALILIIVLVWALVLAPSVTVTVGIRTNSNNFSETMSFTSKLEDEDAKNGKFYLEEKKVETTQKVDFEATGEKNMGEKAHGEVTVIAKVSYRGGTKAVNAGDVFTYNGLKYTADKGVTMSYDGDDDSVCANKDSSTTVDEFKLQGCHIYAKIPVTASQGGSEYNIAASDVGWNTTADVGVSSSAMSGGTDKKIKVVQQIDVENAKKQLASTNEEENKQKLYDSISDDYIVLESTIKQDTSKAVSSPAIDEEVKEGVKPSLTTTTTTSVYVIDATKVAEFITEKANLADDQKIYQMNDPFIEGFMETDKGYTGKIKTTYMTGPKLSSSSILEMIKGHGLGDAQHMLRDYDGVNDVRIDTSVPWVAVIPDDSNKVTVILEVRDQNGNEVKQMDEESENSEDGDEESKGDEESENKDKE